MALERRSASQVVTFSPQQALWTYPVLSGGTGGNQPWAIPFSGLSFLVAGSFPAGTPIAPGDKFQLYTGGNLKESTVFTVQGITPSAGFSAWNIFFGPQPQAIPTSADTAVSLAAPKNPRWLGAIGHVSALTYDFTCPGGPNSMSCLLRLPPDYRTDALNPGRVVQIWRGASCVWEGKLNEPTPAADGWTITAHGAGTYGGDFSAYYLTWNADDAVNRAIARGLRWVNPGIGTPAGIYLAQVQDSGAENITAHLNLLCTGGGLLWMVSRPVASTLPASAWILTVFPLPTDSTGRPTAAVSRIVVSSSPVARSVTADINNIVIRYQNAPDFPATSTKAAVAATFATVFAGNTASTSAHGPMESFLDVSSAGVMTAAAARVIGQNVLTKYIRASFGGPFTVGPGQLLNAAGTPVDLGCEQAGTICQLMVTDAAYGGEVAPGPVTFLTGAYSFDNDTDTATITPFQSSRKDIGSLVAALYPNGKFV